METDERNPLFELRPLRAEDSEAFFAAVEEMRTTDPDWEFALGYEKGLAFGEYVRRLEAWGRGEELPARFVPGWFLVGVRAGKIVGRVSIRHLLNARLSSVGGHIGYGVVPSERRRGLATEMLRRALVLCRRDLGLGRVLVTCEDSNEGSRKVIERCGGLFDGFASEPGARIRTRRYWIPTEGPEGLPREQA